MLSSWWWLPLSVAAGGAVALAMGARRLEAEAAALRRAAAKTAALRSQVAELRADIAAVDKAGGRDLGRR